MTRQEAGAIALDLTRRSTPADGGFCTYQPFVNKSPYPRNRSEARRVADSRGDRGSSPPERAEAGPASRRSSASYAAKIHTPLSGRSLGGRVSSKFLYQIPAARTLVRAAAGASQAGCDRATDEAHNRIGASCGSGLSTPKRH